jgi:hypothetical protein
MSQHDEPLTEPLGPLEPLAVQLRKRAYHAAAHEHDLMLQAAALLESRDQRIRELEIEVERRVYPTARNSG